MKKLSLLLMLPLILLAGTATAQKRTVTGKVTDKKNGTPMSGVSVLVDKKKGGVTTKADGTYSISVESSSSVIIFSYVGYATQSVPLLDKTHVDVVMEASTTVEDEVVVIGYGTQKRTSVTGAVSKYTPEKLDETPSSRLDQALQGKIAG